jgi:hemerythrin-like domain-containing protein
MKPVGPLMVEHRLIEKMIALLGNELKRIDSGEKPNNQLITDGVDFLRTYADRTHHGKEEDILFKRLGTKKLLSDEHRRIMQELLDEHVLARQNVKNLSEANEKQALEDIITALRNITDLYPKHIEKEDQHFFLPVMNYFTDIEQKDMIIEFNSFDQKMIHEKYGKIVEKYK